MIFMFLKNFIIERSYGRKQDFQFLVEVFLRRRKITSWKYELYPRSIKYTRHDKLW